MSKRSVAAGLGLACVVVLTGCGQFDLSKLTTAQSVAEAKAARVAALQPRVDASALKKAGTLTVGIKGGSLAPYSFITSDGTTDGLDIDLACALADQLGLKVEFVQVTTAAKGFETADIVMDVKAGEDTSTTLVGQYGQVATGLFQKDAATGGVSSNKIDAASVRGKNVGVQGNSISARALAQANVGALPVSYTNVNEAFEALAAGEVDFVACDAYAGAYLAANGQKAQLVGLLESPVAVGIGVAGSNQALQKAVQDALSQVQSNGVDGLIRMWWIRGLPALTDALKIVQ